MINRQGELSFATDSDALSKYTMWVSEASDLSGSESVNSGRALIQALIMMPSEIKKKKTKVPGWRQLWHEGGPDVLCREISHRKW